MHLSSACLAVENNIRKISKYQLDRADIDFEYLKREKAKEAAIQAKAYKDEQD